MLILYLLPELLLPSFPSTYPGSGFSSSGSEGRAEGRVQHFQLVLPERLVSEQGPVWVCKAYQGGG